MTRKEAASYLAVSAAVFVLVGAFVGANAIRDRAFGSPRPVVLYQVARVCPL